LNNDTICHYVGYWVVNSININVVMNINHLMICFCSKICKECN
jgi:hypothetical protein